MQSQPNIAPEEIPTITNEIPPGDGVSRSPRAMRAGLITVAKVSHTLNVSLADRLEEFAFRQRVSESAVIEYALTSFFSLDKEEVLGERLRDSGAGRRRRA